MHHIASPKELAEARRSCGEMADNGCCTDPDALRLLIEHYDDLLIEVEIMHIAKQMGTGANTPRPPFSRGEYVLSDPDRR